MKPDRKWVVVITACTALAGAFFAGRVWATGIPTPGTLTYTGSLANPDGTPVTATSKNIGITAYDAATAGAIVPECTVASGPVGITLGQFQIQLPDTCSAKIQATPNLWIDVTVDGGSLGHTKLGAVPYAVEAGHAVSADLATNATTAMAASGALDTRIGTIESRVTAIEAASSNKSAFKAHLAQATTIPNDAYTTIAFGAEKFDFGAEYDPTTGVFSPKSSGYFHVACAVYWTDFAASGTGPFFAARLTVNDAWAAQEGGDSTGHYTSRSVQNLLKLNANDRVVCQGRQTAGADRALYFPVPVLSQFEAFRVTP